MIISITGANGYIGKLLVKLLISKGITVHILCRNQSEFEFTENVKVFKGDLTDPYFNATEFLKDCDVLVNCAGALSDETKMFKLHVDSSIRLYNSLKEISYNNNKKVKWIQLSSVGAYGPPSVCPSQVRVINENFNCIPKSIYEISKTLFDKFLIEQDSVNSNIEYVILRPSNIFGPNMTNSSLIGLMKSIKSGLFFFIGKKGSVATYVYESDVINAIELCIQSQNAKGIYNISNDCSFEKLVYSISDSWFFLRVPEPAVRMIVNLNIFLKNILTHERISALVNRTTYSSEKIQNELGFKFMNKIEDDFKYFFNYIKENKL